MRYVHKNLSVLETKMIWEDNLSLAGGMQCCKAAVELGKKTQTPRYGLLNSTGVKQHRGELWPMGTDLLQRGRSSTGWWTPSQSLARRCRAEQVSKRAGSVLFFSSSFKMNHSGRKSVGTWEVPTHRWLTIENTSLAFPYLNYLGG